MTKNPKNNGSYIKMIVEYKKLNGNSTIEEYDEIKPIAVGIFDATNGKISLDMECFNNGEFVNHISLWNIIRIYDKKEE